ncbi:MAG: septal ring lytic transglycosylase RlpA family protein [Alphaproteobacteria bacterium]|nr:septal ring lytic transglycosylase RlpA family protein [Alphaproteobacteria bacterium]
MIRFRRNYSTLPVAIFLSATLALAACGGGGNPRQAASGAPTGQAKAPPADIPYKLGKPYTVAGVRYVPRDDRSYDRTGMASWYGKDFHGKPAATGRPYNMYEMTAAHTTLPTGTQVRVTNLENGRSVIVVIADRGPFSKKRIIDLSYAAANHLGFVNQGTAKVRVTYLRPARQG